MEAVAALPVRPSNTQSWIRRAMRVLCKSRDMLSRRLPSKGVFVATLAFNHEEITARELKPALLELDGISRETVEAHHKLYEGYVAKRHEIYFEHLGGPGGEPDGAIAQLIRRDFGSTAKWRADLKATGMAGRGWAWTPHD